MKKIVLFVFLCNFYLIAQEYIPCGTAASSPQYPPLNAGLHISSKGIVKALYIFAQFRDDNYLPNDVNWPKNQPPSAAIRSLIDSTVTQNSVNGGLTHYFYDMSRDSFKLIGKSIYIRTPHTRDWYLNQNKTRGFINKEVIKAADTLLSFEQFDNWRKDSDYNHTNVSDTYIDMIFIIYRNIAQETLDPNGISFTLGFDNWGGEATLGQDTTFTVDNGARIVKMGAYPATNAGVTIKYNLNSNPSQITSTCAHEFGHYLFGQIHFSEGMHGLMSVWGISQRSMMMNSWERNRLNWVTVHDYSTTTDNVVVNDYLSCDEVVKITIPTQSEYFLIENHQRINTWWGSPDQDESAPKGLYVLRGTDSAAAQLICADGRWTWTVVGTRPNPYGGTNALPVYQRVNPSRYTGRMDNQRISGSYNGTPYTEFIHFYRDPASGQVIEKAVYRGDGTDQFDLVNNNLFTKWSNPSSCFTNGTDTNFGFHVKSKSNNAPFGESFTIKIYNNDFLSAPPSKPQNFFVSIHNTGDNAHPKLNWVLLTESDVSNCSQGYLIERSQNGGAFSQIATVNGTTSEYIDYGISWAGSGQYSATYRIRANDTQGLTSVYTPSRTIFYGDAWKISVDNESGELNYKLDQNFPNPFNPSTTIQYELPEAGLVELKIYDMLGNEIQTLVNEFKTEGKYSLAFNSGSLASGVYILSLKAAHFAMQRKMTLLK